MADKTIEAKPRLRWSGYSSASCSSAELPPLHRTPPSYQGGFERSTDQNYGPDISLFKPVFCPNFSGHTGFPPEYGGTVFSEYRFNEGFR